MHLRGALLILLTACGVDPAQGDGDSGFATGVSVPATTGGATTAEPDPGASSGVLTEAISEPWMDEAETTTSATSTTSGSTGDDPLADCPRLRVVVPVNEVLNVRPTPSTAEEPVGELANGALVDAVAAVQGEVIDGNGLWYEIAGPNVAGYVFSGFVMCTTDEPPPAPDGFFLPLECGKMATVTQGNDGDVSHQGKDFYAFDFGLGLGTPMVAMAAGVVHHIYDLTKPGDPCYDGGGPECGPYGNLVVVLHGDNTSTYYKHLSEVHVTLGQEVARAQLLGLSGSTGYSTGPHAHIMRQENCGSPKCQSIPLEFVEAGVPVEGQVVVSMNCP
jgi:murein DD-endopeptidase MepM/ murein hydrolase activator NlpD